MEPEALTQTKYQLLREKIKAQGRLAIAFSGGVDSSLLAKVCHDQLGKGALLLFADSPLLPDGSRQEAVATAQAIGARLLVVDFDPLAAPEFVVNPPDRCYHCKRLILTRFLALAGELGFTALAEGTNLDDLSRDRPGLRAVAELGVISPLSAAKLSKTEIRSISRALGLSTWDKPAASCLATRIPAGRPVTRKALELVERAEAVLTELGYQGSRARLTEDGCRLELAAGGLGLMADRGDFIRVRERLRGLGLAKVFLDLLEREGILS